MSELISDSSIHNIPVLAPVGRECVLRKKPNTGNRVRLRDARQLYLLVGECRGLGIDGLVWRRHLTKQLRLLMEADFVAFIDLPASNAAGAEDDAIKPLSIVENGSLDGVQTAHSEFILSSISSVEQLCHDAQSWARAHVMRLNRSTRRARADGTVSPQLAAQVAEPGNVLVSINPGPDKTTQLLYAYRQRVKPPFSRRIVHLLRALWVELRILQPDELVRVENSVFTKYPRRMLQVLACLLAGNTAKETAALLDISIHTVQEHTKRLYKRTDTSNRAELAECFHSVAPLLVATPLSEYPDYHQTQNGILRDHRV